MTRTVDFFSNNVNDASKGMEMTSKTLAIQGYYINSLIWSSYSVILKVGLNMLQQELQTKPTNSLSGKSSTWNILYETVSDVSRHGMMT